ncbi:hypothetical protein J6590_040955 [Homalodisca vitripennis]|nr:hypothetical protein J6590_040955 [Homalodisca vitripennis]
MNLVQTLYPPKMSLKVWERNKTAATKSSSGIPPRMERSSQASEEAVLTPYLSRPEYSVTSESNEKASLGFNAIIRLPFS